MSAFEVKSLPPVKRANDFTPCENGCTTMDSQYARMRRAATHEVLIAGYPVLVCAACAGEWAEAWAGASERKEVAA